MTGLALMLALTVPALAVNDFVDVPATHPYYAAITYLASRGVSDGYGDGSFGPGDPVTRQQFAKEIVRTLGLTVTGHEICPFGDVAKGTAGAPDPFYPDKYVALCYEKGFIEPKTPTTFAPFDYLSRAELITVAARAANLSDPPVAYDPPFGSFSPDHYSWARKAAYVGLLDGLQGMGPGFDFFQNATRGECAQVLHDLLLRTQPENAGTTLGPSQTLPAAQASATTEIQLRPTEGTAASESPRGVERVFPSAYLITGICLGVLVAAGTILLVRRARSARGRSARPTGLTRQPIAPEDAMALLRHWEAEKMASPPPPVLTMGCDVAALWGEPTEPTPGAQPGKGSSTGETGTVVAGSDGETGDGLEPPVW